MLVLDNTIMPQAEEVNDEVREHHQTTTFMDAEPGEQIGDEAPVTVLTEAPMSTDMTLEHFMSRPIKIQEITWPAAGGLIVGVNPWADFFSNTRVVNRIANFKLLQCDLHVKLVINGTPFHYGAAMMSYIPLYTNDQYSNVSSGADSYKVLASQRPNIMINPTTSSGGEMTLPFFYYRNALDVPSNDWSKMGFLIIESFTPLKHANDANQDIEMQLFAWATNVRLGVPTHVNPIAIVPQADEYTSATGPISKPAGIVANIAARLKTAPWIGPYARATEIGASAVSALASVFGYSRPVLLESSVYRPLTKGSIAVTNMPDDTQKMSVDCKQELTIDSRTVGLQGQDELDINYIASKPSYLCQFDWDLGTNEETLLWNSVVNPMIYRDNADGSTSHTAMSFASLPFKKWRGSIKFHFKIVASAFHRGRLVVCYDPVKTRPDGLALGEYNTAHHMIVDLAETTEFDYVVGWGQTTTYRDLGDVTNLEDDWQSTTPLFYDSTLDKFGNGTVSVRVANKLVSPDNTIDNFVTVLVWVSACDDLEFAMPTGEKVNRMRISDSSNPSPSTDLVVPQAEEVVAQKTSLVDATNHVHFGEAIRSFRQLLKRYSRHESFSITPSASSAFNHRFQRSMLPFFPGYYTAASSAVLKTTAGGAYAYGNTPLITYITSAFVGWRGSTRVLVDLHGMGCCKAKTSAFATRYSNCQPTQVTTNDGVTTTFDQQSVVFYDDGTGQEGGVINSTEVNPLVSFEVPYYSEYRFSLSRQAPGFDSNGPFNMPCWKLLTSVAQTDDVERISMPVFYAAGEDFTPFFYIGPPPMFYEAIPPVTT